MGLISSVIGSIGSGNLFSGVKDIFGKGGKMWSKDEWSGQFGDDMGTAMSTASMFGQNAINKSNTDYNTQYGMPSDTAVGIRSAVGEAIPIFGAINSVMNLGQSLLNKGNDYNEYGYNEREGYGKFYTGLGGALDPAGSAIKSLEEGGEGSGARALLSLTGLGGIAQFNYEQERALEREEREKKIEESNWNLSQFNYTPNLDV